MGVARPCPVYARRFVTSARSNLTENRENSKTLPRNAGRAGRCGRNLGHFTCQISKQLHAPQRY